MKKTPAPIIIDQETELRHLEDHDAPEIFALVEQNRTYLRTWLPWVDATRSVEDERLFIRMLQAQYTENQAFSCGIWYQGQIIGTIGYHPIDWVKRKVEIGYWLAAAFQGKGLMTKANQALITYAFDTLKLDKVEIHCAVGNTRSCAIPQRLGFKQEHIIKRGEWLYDHTVDLQVFSISASAWHTEASDICSTKSSERS